MSLSTDASHGRYFESFASARAVMLTTFRSNGDPVPTPVWLVTDEDHAYVISRGRGKEKRIRANPAVEVARAEGTLAPGT